MDRKAAQQSPSHRDGCATPEHAKEHANDARPEGGLTVSFSEKLGEVYRNTIMKITNKRRSNCVGNWNNEEDVVQETFARIIEKRRDIEKDAPIGAVVYNIQKSLKSHIYKRAEDEKIYTENEVRDAAYALRDHIHHSEEQDNLVMYSQIKNIVLRDYGRVIEKKFSHQKTREKVCLYIEMLMETFPHIKYEDRHLRDVLAIDQESLLTVKKKAYIVITSIAAQHNWKGESSVPSTSAPPGAAARNGFDHGPEPDSPIRQPAG